MSGPPKETVSTPSERSQQQLEFDRAALERLHELSERLISQNDLPTLLQAVIDAAIDLKHAQMGTLQLYDEASQSLRIVAQRGFQKPFLDHFAVVHEDPAVCGEALRRRERVIVEDVSKSPIFLGTPTMAVMEAAGVRAVQATPLLSRDGRLLGMIATHWTEPHRPQESTLRLLDFLAREAASLIEHRQREEMLRQSEERFRQLSEAMPLLVWTADATGAIDYVNPQTREFAGKQPADIHGWNWKNFLHPDDLQATVSAYRRALTSGEPYRIEHRVRRTDGQYRWFLTSAVPLRNDKGEVTRWIGTATDITERKQAEEALRRAAAFDEAALKCLGEGLYTIDANGLVTSMNPAAGELFGWTFAELRGKKMHDMTHHHYRDGRSFPSSECAGFHVLTHGMPLKNHEDVFIRKDGTFFDVHYSIAPMRDAGGKITGLVVVFSDISERKRAEARLVYLASFPELNPNPIVEVDLDGRVRYANPTALKLFPDIRDKGEAHPWLSGWRSLARSITNGSEFPTRVVTIDDRSFYQTLFRLSQEDSVRIYGLDITERKRAEDELRRLHAELEQRVQERTAELNISLEALRKEMKDREAAEMAVRELNRQLQRLQDEERRKISRELHDSAGQTLVALSIHTAMLETAVIGHSNPRIAEFISAISDLAQQLSKELRTMSYLLHPPLLEEAGLETALSWFVKGFTERSGIETDLEISPNFGRLPAAFELTIFRIIQESLTNVHRHSGSSKAHVTMERNGSEVKVEITDWGKGMALPDKATSTNHGVGLMGMQERVRQLNGRLRILSGPGGTSIVAVLPSPPPLQWPA